MKLTIEKQEWQLLGQIAIEISQVESRKTMMLQSLIIWEFYIDNIPAFTLPQTRKKKIRASAAVAIFQYLHAEKSRDDILWDTTMWRLKEKIYKKIREFKHEDPITASEN